MAHQLKHGRKTLYLHYQRFLKSNHPYRRLKQIIYEHQENDDAPIPLIDLQIHEKVNKAHHVLKNVKEIIYNEPLEEKSQYSLIFHIGRSERFDIA